MNELLVILLTLGAWPQLPVKQDCTWPELPTVKKVNVLPLKLLEPPLEILPLPKEAPKEKGHWEHKRVCGPNGCTEVPVWVPDNLHSIQETPDLSPNGYWSTEGRGLFRRKVWISN